jgi:hypothetical protein
MSRKPSAKVVISTTPRQTMAMRLEISVWRCCFA